MLTDDEIAKRLRRYKVRWVMKATGLNRTAVYDARNGLLTVQARTILMKYLTEQSHAQEKNHQP